MIARARAIAHGNAYTTYSTLKRNAEFVCCENMAGDMTVAVTEDDLDSIWMQFKYAGENYIPTGKPVTRNLVAMEVSPTKEESKGWTMEQWNLFAHRVIEEMDKIEFRNKEGKVSSKRTDFACSKWLAMLHHDAKSGIPHLHFMISRFTVDGRINDTNLIGLKATMAANSINQSMGWRQSQDISEEHKAEIKDTLYDILRSMEKFDWDVYLRKIKERGYDAELRRDSNGKVVGYRIMRGNSRYNASQIARQLTANRIATMWRQIHRTMVSERPKVDEAHGSHQEKGGQKKPRHYVCEPVRPGTESKHYEFDRSLDGRQEPEHFIFDISQNVVDALSDTFMELANDFEFVFEQVMEVSIFMFFELLTVDTGVQGSSYSSGNAKDVSSKKKRDDDDDELYRARRIAQSVARSCPKKVIRRGFRR